MTAFPFCRVQGRREWGASWVGIVAGGLLFGPALAPSVLAQGLPTDALENAIGRCIGKEGATGDAVGELTLDLKTGKTVYRCASDSTPQPLTPAASAGAMPKETGAAKEAAPSKGTSQGKGTGQGTSQDKPAAAVDKGATAVWINRPSEPPPERPQECVGAHPAYRTLPVCVIAARLGLMKDGAAQAYRVPKAPPQDTSLDYTQPPPVDLIEPEALPQEGGGAAPVAEAFPDPGTPSPNGPASSAPPQTASAPWPPADDPVPVPPPATSLPAPNSPAAAVLPPPGVSADKAEQEARTARTITLMPEGAQEAIAQAKAAREKERELERQRRQAERAKAEGGDAADDSGEFSFTGLLVGLATVLGGLMAVAGVGLGIAILLHRIKVHRAAKPDDPYVAYYDEDEKDEEASPRPKGKAPVPKADLEDDYSMAS
ncbi:hypothetical protein [Pararhodospirillum photometricum]|nr:hypothetical protein [Pararhodospirillum photometricum]